jgi:hypothetical protein
VIFELEHRVVPVRQHDSIKRLLKNAPWCWPERDDERRAFASLIADGDIPSLAVGDVAAVTVTDDATSLWLLTGEQRAGWRPTAWGPEAQDAWSRAAVAVPRSLPLLWTSMVAAAARVPLAYHLASWPRSNCCGLPQPILDGPSFGLAFALALTARLFNQQLPDDFVATARIDSDGKVWGVAGIIEKLEGIRALAPRIRRVIVASDQQEEAHDAAPDLTIVPVSSIAQAVSIVFNEGLARLLVRAGSDAETRGELVASFFQLVADGRRAMVDWTPVKNAAALALEKWKCDLAESQVIELEFAHAVAARHEDNQGALPVPPARWFDGKPLPLRVSLIATLVQQAADTGIPSSLEVEALARPYLASAHEAHVPQLKLLGAMGRLWAVNGRPEDALEQQEHVAGALFASFEYEQVSFQLAEWFRLAGACGDVDAWHRADVMLARIVQRGGFSRHSEAFVSLGRARGAVRLGPAAAIDPYPLLEALSTDSEIPVHVRWSATRWRISLDDACGVRDTAIEAALDAAASGDHRGATPARIFQTMVTLDRCVRGGDLRLADAVLDTLEVWAAGPVRQLRAAAPRDPAAYVATFFPY